MIIVWPATITAITSINGLLKCFRHQAREAEPKNYDISNNAVRDLCKATYKRIGNVTDGSLPDTTYQAMADQINLKDDFTEQEFKQNMVNGDTHMGVDLDR